jgi:two-component system nitrate/nitrite response regulator NarL
MADGRPIRILIADDHPIFRDGLRRLLETRAEFQVVGEAADGAEALRLAGTLEPDILLLDVAMPRVTGLAALERLATEHPTVQIVLLTALIERADLVTALQRGVRGVVLKEVATELLFQAIRAVMAGEYWVDRQSMGDLVQALRDSAVTPDKPARRNAFGLTRREIDVIGAVVAGLSNRDIAQRFSISEETVKHHLSNVFDKVGVSTRLELALFAVHHKVVDAT